MALSNSPTIPGLVTWIQEFLGRFNPPLDYTIGLHYSSLDERWTGQVNAQTQDGQRSFTVQAKAQSEWGAMEQLCQRLKTVRPEDFEQVTDPSATLEPQWQKPADVDVREGTHLADGSYVIPESMTNG